MEIPGLRLYIRNREFPPAGGMSRMRKTLCRWILFFSPALSLNVCFVSGFGYREA
jgi:hypothetical protein